MKKKLFGFIFAFVFVLAGAMCLTACNKDPKVYKVKISSSQGNYTYLYLGNGEGSYSESYEVEEGKNFSKYLYLDGKYNPDTLKIYNGSTEVVWQREDNLDTSVVTTDRVKVGTLKFDNVKSDINLKYEAQEKRVTFTFNYENKEQLQQYETMLKDFTLTSNPNKDLYTMIYNSESITMDYSQVGTPISITSKKPIGYYSVQSGFMSVGSNFVEFDENVNHSKYSYTLKFPTNITSLNNQIDINLEKIQVSTIFIDSANLGSIATISSTDSYLAGDDKMISITLNPIDGVDISSAQLYLNDTLVNFTSGQAFKLDYPINYMQGDLDEYDDFRTIKFTIKNVTITSDANFCKIKEGTLVGNNMKASTRSYYYYDSTSKTAYYSNTENEAWAYLYNGGAPISTVTINDGANNYVINLSEFIAAAGNDIENSVDKSDILKSVYSTVYPDLPITTYRVLASAGEVLEIEIGLKSQTGITYTISANN